jgi:hypothetical protein
MPNRFAWLYSCSLVRPLLLELEPERRRDELEPEDERERDDERELELEREPELERELELERDLEEELFVSPFCARCLLTVRAAISLARFVERPCFFSESLMCSYCRSRFELQAFGIAENLLWEVMLRGCCAAGGELNAG